MRRIKLFTVWGNHLFWENNIICHQQWSMASCCNLKLDASNVLIPKICCEKNTALNISYFEGYNFTYSIRQVASKTQSKNTLYIFTKRSRRFPHISLCQQVLLWKADNRASCQHSDVQIQNVFKSSTSTVLFLLHSRSYSPLLSGSLMLQLPLTQSALQRNYRRYYFCKRWRSSLCKRTIFFPSVMYYSNFSTFTPLFLKVIFVLFWTSVTVVQPRHFLSVL